MTGTVEPLSANRTPAQIDADRVAALNLLIKNKQAQIVANQNLVEPAMIVQFENHLKQAQDELAKLVAKIKADAKV